MHWQKAPGLEGKQHCKCQLKHLDSCCAADKLHMKLWEQECQQWLCSKVLRAFLWDSRFLLETFGSALQIMPDLSPAMTPEGFLGWVICWTRSPVPSVLTGRKGTNVNIEFSLKRCKGASLMPSRPASCYCFDPAPSRIQPRTAPALGSVNLTSDMSQPMLLPNPGQAGHSIKVSQESHLGWGLLHTKHPLGTLFETTHKIHSLVLFTKLAGEFCLPKLLLSKEPIKSRDYLHILVETFP